MKQKIISIIFSDKGIQIIGFFITIIVAFITAKLASKSSRKNLVTQYFKEQSVNIQEKVLRFWCGLFMGEFKIIETYYDIINKPAPTLKETSKEEARILTEIQKESFMCCSKKTIKSIKDYMQYIYKTTGEKAKETKTLIQIVLIARIICRMKYDFTGERANVLDLIRIKIKDYNIVMQIKSIISLIWYNFKDIFY